MIEVGQTYYFIAHAYWHYVGEVTEILGVRRVACKRVVQVHSCGRPWTRFFAEGFATDTKHDFIGEAADLSYIVAFAWPHPIPEKKDDRSRR